MYCAATVEIQYRVGTLNKVRLQKKLDRNRNIENRNIKDQLVETPTIIYSVLKGALVPF